VAGFCECGDEPSGSGATELFNYVHEYVVILANCSSLNVSLHTCRNCGQFSNSGILNEC
jgi:hypothetical protein